MRALMEAEDRMTASNGFLTMLAVSLTVLPSPRRGENAMRTIVFLFHAVMAARSRSARQAVPPRRPGPSGRWCAATSRVNSASPLQRHAAGRLQGILPTCSVKGRRRPEGVLMPPASSGPIPCRQAYATYSPRMLPYAGRRRALEDDTRQAGAAPRHAGPGLRVIAEPGIRVVLALGLA